MDSRFTSMRIGTCHVRRDGRLAFVTVVADGVATSVE